LLLFKPISIDQFADFIARFQLKLKYQTTIPMMGEPWDRVTGLYNQSFFVDRLGTTLMQAKANTRNLFAVLAIRIDPNCCIRSDLGISKWIAALRETAETLQIAARPADVIARFDQDNFYVLLENIPGNEVALAVAYRIHNKLKEKLAATDNRENFPISTRVLLGDGRYEDTDRILHEVELARAIPDFQEECHRAS
jgi:diguanylate cyclase (GGDEF)-like protein